MNDELTPEEIERREAERVSRANVGARSKLNLLDTKAVLQNMAARKGTKDTKDKAAPVPRAPSGALSPRAAAPATAPAPAAGAVSPRAVPEWKRQQLEREEAERRRADEERAAREAAARQIEQRVKETGLTVETVDDELPEFVRAAGGANTYDPTATPSATSSAPTTWQPTRFDASSVPDAVSTQSHSYERIETFDPAAAPSYVSERPTYYAPSAAAPVQPVQPAQPSAGAQPAPAAPRTVTVAMPVFTAAPAAAAPPAAAAVPAPIPATPAPAVAASVPPFVVQPLDTLDERTSRLTVINLACPREALTLVLAEGGRALHFARSLHEPTGERRESQTFHLPFQVTAGGVAATYEPAAQQGRLTLRLTRPVPVGAAPGAEHEVCRFVVPGAAGSAAPRVSVGIEQRADRYVFRPGPAAPHDTAFTVVLTGSRLEFRTSLSQQEGATVRVVSGKQSVDLPLAPLLSQLQVHGTEVHILHSAPPPPEAAVASTHIPIA